MRRMWAASAAGLLCLALGGMPVAAQAEAVTVTATQDCVIGSTITCTYTASDPRVAGSGSHVFTGGASETGASLPGGAVGVSWADTRIEGPEGAWTGHHYIVSDGTGATQVLIMLAGEGAYDGWAYITYGTDPIASPDHDLVGVIYQGALPPVGPLPSAAGE